MARMMPGEADVICRCLIDRAATPQEAQRYEDGLRALNVELSPGLLWRLGCAHPFLLGLVDAGLAVLRPMSAMRRRIHLMAAVLEASPDNVAWFLANRHGGLQVALIAFRAALRTVAGVLLVLCVEPVERWAASLWK